MTKKMFWFACLGLLCCGVFALAVFATGPGSASKMNASVSQSKPVIQKLNPAEEAAIVNEQGYLEATTGKPVEMEMIEAEIAMLEAQLGSVAADEAAVPMDLKARLNELYAVRPANSRRSLDQGNDACPATVIGALPYTDTGTTTGMTNDWGTCIGNTAPDVIYSFTPSSTAQYMVSLCGSGYDTALEIRTGGACPGTTQVGCNDDSGPACTGLQSSILANLTAGTQYFIIVDGFSSSAGNYTLNVFQPQPCVITCQGGDVQEVTEPAVPDSANMASDPNGGCNNTSGTPLFQNINCGQTVCGRGFTYLRPSGTQVRDTDWYLFTISQPCTVRVNARAEFPVLTGIVRNVSPCNAPAFVVSATQTTPCSLATVTAVCLAPGTYAMFVAPSVFTGVNNGRYRATLTCSAPCPPCTPDQTINAPATITGTTVGGVDNCNLRTGEDRIYRINIPTTGNWTFTMCDTAGQGPNFDSFIYLTDQCCAGTIIASNDDGCGYVGRSRITCVNLTAGTYYLDVEPFSSGATGAYRLQVVQCQPCVITCQGGDIQEPAEPAVPDSANMANDPTGGCNNTSGTPLFGAINCGQTVCGRGFTYLRPSGTQVRDTDWYLFTITQPETITVRVQAEFPALFGIVRNVQPCNAPAFVVSGTTALACDSGQVSAVCLTPGTYAMFVAPNVFTGVPATARYRARLICSTPCAPCVPDYTINAPGSVGPVTTCGRGDNCNLRTGEDLTIRINIPTTGEWNIEFCLPDDQAWDSYAYLTDACCGGTIIAQSDDDCQDNSDGFDDPRFTCIQLNQGTYYVDYEPFSAGVCSLMRVEVTPCLPCSIQCITGDVIEVAENPADTTFYRTDPNGGCNSDPASYQDINIGQTVCGESFNYAGPTGEFRDTDWYRFTVACSTALQATVAAEFFSAVYFLSYPDCDNIALIGQGANTGNCDTIVVTSTVVGPGTYYLFVAPDFANTGLPPSEYRATVTTVTPCACDPVDDLTVYLTPNNQNTWLHWSATAGEQYRIYSTTDKSYPGLQDPPNPPWTLVTTVTATGAVAEWTDPTAIVPYKRYAVIHLCD